MYDPPAGFDDMMADADATIHHGDPYPLEVNGVGTVMCRKPAPKSAALLAMAANPKVGRDGQVGYLNRFVSDHVGEDKFDDLLVGMVEGRHPTETVQLVARAIATWGTARPYTAVINLAMITAQHWRRIRSHLLDAGVADPMRLSSMHALLDIAENVAIESLAHSGTGKDAAKQGKRKVTEFLDGLYRPDQRDAATLNGDGYKPVPSGFDDDTMEASFDAFLSAAR